jgi:peptide/nickel transport system substrate-binding protein
MILRHVPVFALFVTPALLLAIACGGEPSRPAATGAPTPQATTPQSPIGAQPQSVSQEISQDSSEGVPENLSEAPAESSAAMPTAIAQNTDAGVRVPERPDPPTEMAPIPTAEPHVSSPPWREDFFPPGRRRGGRIVTTNFSDPRTFNFVIANDSASTDIIDICWSYLLDYNRHTQSVAQGLAHAWEVDESGTTWTFHLREGLVFSDGSPIVAEDFARYLRVIYTEGLANPHGDILKAHDQPFTWETPNPLTLVIHTPGVFSAMELQAGSIPPLPADPWERALQSDDPAAAIAQLHGLDTDPKTIVTSGPFTIDSFRSGERTILRRNPHYPLWDANGDRLPYIDEVVYLNVPDQSAMRLRFEGGQSDILDPLVPQDYAKLRDGARPGGWTVWDLGPALSRSFLWFNLNTRSDPDTGEPFVDPVKSAWFNRVEFRRAVAHAIDREAMIDLVLNGRGTPKIAFESVSNLFWCNRNATHYPYDVDRAKSLLDEIDFIDRDGDGVREDPDGNPIRFTMITNRGNESREKIIVLVQEDLAAIGIDMVPALVDFPQLVERLNDTFQYESCLLGLGGGTPDPTTGLNVLRSSGRTHLWNPLQESPSDPAEARIDALCDALLATLDPQEQQRFYFEIQEILGQQSYMIWLADPNAYVATRNKFDNLLPSIVEDRVLWNVTSIWHLTE